MDSVIQCDALVIGAGLSGMSMLHRLRKLGLKTKVFESGADFGGVWYWNRYPGARVDSEFPIYQLTLPEVYRDWEFTERFPSGSELRAYVAHVDKVLDLRKDVQFNAHVEDIRWSEQTNQWTVKTKQGHMAQSKYMILCTGLLHRRHTPEFPGINSYKGDIHHSGHWPEGLSVKGKKVAVIGAGATGVQLTQELSKQADHLTVFLRQPPFCFPMGQRPISAEEQQSLKPTYDEIFHKTRHSFGGFPGTPRSESVFDVTAEERERICEDLWSKGGFRFSAATFSDFVVNKEANKVLYDFWARKTRQRIKDARKRDIMAPLEMPYYFATKRVPLEQDYYECLDRDNVDIVSMKETPIKTFNGSGMLLSNGQQLDFDAVILATGFDSFTGALTQIGLKNRENVDVKDIWRDGVRSYLGMNFHGFPNAFMVYTPHAPAALTNGPTLLEAQCDFVTTAIEKLEAEGARYIEATREAEDQWIQLVEDQNAPTLFPLTISWWNGGNVPGKKVQSYNYLGGIQNYESDIRGTLEGWKGFTIVH